MTAQANGPRTIEDDVGPEVYQELLADFLSDLTPQLADLENAGMTGDVPAARRIAHQIKGTALSFGAVGLDALVDRLLQLDGGETDLLRSLVNEVRVEVRSLQAG